MLHGVLIVVNYLQPETLQFSFFILKITVNTDFFAFFLVVGSKHCAYFTFFFVEFNGVCTWTKSLIE